MRGETERVRRVSTNLLVLLLFFYNIFPLKFTDSFTNFYHSKVSPKLFQTPLIILLFKFRIHLYFQSIYGYLKVSRIAELHTMCPNLHTTTTFTPLTPSWHFPQWLFSAVNRRPQLTFEITIAITITMRATRASLSLFLSFAALCVASIKGFSVFPTCLPHEILFISCVLSSLFRPRQVQIAVQAWMDEEDRVKSYTTKMEICKDETKWNEMHMHMEDRSREADAEAENQIGKSTWKFMRA